MGNKFSFTLWTQSVWTISKYVLFQHTTNCKKFPYLFSVATYVVGTSTINGNNTRWKQCCSLCKNSRLSHCVPATFWCILLAADNSFSNSLYHKWRVTYPKNHVSLLNFVVFHSYTGIVWGIAVRQFWKCFEFRWGWRDKVSSSNLYIPRNCRYRMLNNLFNIGRSRYVPIGIRRLG